MIQLMLNLRWKVFVTSRTYLVDGDNRHHNDYGAICIVVEKQLFVRVYTISRFLCVVTHYCECLQLFNGTPPAYNNYRNVFEGLLVLIYKMVSIMLSKRSILNVYSICKVIHDQSGSRGSYRIASHAWNASDHRQGWRQGAHVAIITRWRRLFDCAGAVQFWDEIIRLSSPHVCFQIQCTRMVPVTATAWTTQMNMISLSMVGRSQYKHRSEVIARSSALRPPAYQQFLAWY